MVSHIDVKAVGTPTSLIYQYGIRLDRSQENIAGLLDSQFALAHRLYNDLVALSREVLAGIQAALESKEPSIRDLRLRQNDLYERRRIARSADDRDTFATLTKEVRVVNRELMQRLFEARRAYRDDISPFLDSLSTTKSTSRAYALRSDYVKQGLYWATAGATLRAFATAWKKQWPKMKGPNFRRSAEQDRRVLTDQMNDRSGGVTQEELHSGRYRLWVTDPLSAGAGKYLPFRMRIGPNGLDLTGTVQWHRPLPVVATVTEVRFVEQRVARQRKYYLQFQLRLQSQDPARNNRADQVAGLALGWYRDGDTRRIGAITDTTRHEAAEVIRMPADVLEDLERVDGWSSDRDKARNEIVAQLRAKRPVDPPEPLAARLNDILRLPPEHIAPARLASMVLTWRDAYSEFEPETLAILEQWRKSDATLWERCAHTRRRALNRRRNFYLSLAAQWANRYETLMLHDLDLTKMAMIKDDTTGEHNDLGAKARHGRYVAALSELESACVQAMQKNGGRVVVVSDGTASQCSVCSADVPELSSTVEVSCPSCGEAIEKRTNAAANLRAYYDAHRSEIDQAVEEAMTEQQLTLEKRKDQQKRRSEARSASAAERRGKQTGEHV